MLPALCAGGAERILITLMNNLDRERFEPLFLTLNDKGPVKEWIDPQIPFYSFKNRTIKSSVFKLIAFIREHKPDVIFTTMVHCNGLALLMKIFFPHIRVIVREAALPSVIIKEYGLKGRLCYLIYKFLYPKADIVISNCSQVIAEFENKIKIPIRNHQILFNPVDTQRIYQTLPDTLESFEGRETTAYFVCVGRLSYEKGYDRLIEALATTPPEEPWRLDFIGEGDFRSTLEALIDQHNLNDHVFLRGYHSNPWQIATQADCLLLPSRWEGMPNVVLEGFACGVPAIAMREAGGIVDIGKHAKSEYLCIVDTMDDFLKSMGKIAIKPKAQKAESLLPSCFLLPHIIQQLDLLLTETSSR